jgi:hypothetical protein
MDFQSEQELHALILKLYLHIDIDESGTVTHEELNEGLKRVDNNLHINKEEFAYLLQEGELSSTQEQITYPGIEQSNGKRLGSRIALRVKFLGYYPPVGTSSRSLQIRIGKAPQQLEQKLVQLLFHEVQNAFMSKLIKHCALTNVNSDRGFEFWSGYEVKPPDCHSSLEAHGHWIPATGHIFGRRADVAHPRPGSFGSHGHRIDFCESTVFN